MLTGTAHVQMVDSVQHKLFSAIVIKIVHQFEDGQVIKWSRSNS
jgi:hypothetical protein